MVSKNGSMEPYTKVNGSTTKQKATELSGMPRAISTQANSKLIKLTVLVSTLT
jgi:hypothetical protein